MYISGLCVCASLKSNLHKLRAFIHLSRYLKRYRPSGLLHSISIKPPRTTKTTKITASIMPGTNTVTALRGFRVRLTTLDKYLVANDKVHGAQNGFAPFYHFEKPEGPDEISALLRANGGGSSGILYVVPAAEGHDITPYVYVAYQYRHVYSQLRITPQDPPEEPVPAAFEELRQEILGYRAGPGDGAAQEFDEDDGAMGLYIVYTEGRSAPEPPELEERYKVSYQHALILNGVSGLPLANMRTNGRNPSSATGVTRLSYGGLTDSGTLTKSMELMNL